MGIKLFSSSCADKCNCFESKYNNSNFDINPDPSNYKIIKSLEMCNYLIIKICYPNCINYEGYKILVFHNVKLSDLVEKQKLIDPHFSDNKKFISPIARFTPTEEGWNMAKKFALSMS